MLAIKVDIFNSNFFQILKSTFVFVQTAYQEQLSLVD